MAFHYDVFISYRHRPLDNVITKGVFETLERYRMPRPLREQGFSDIRRVFRDTEELAVSKILTETIDDALRSSNCLVVICTLDAPLSPWVDREVSMFIKMGRADYIYPLLVNGDPERSFPPSLKLVPDVMDRLMDVRCEGDDPKKIMAKAELQLLKVIARVAGCEEDDLVREHKHRRNRRFAVRTGAAAAAFVAVAGISLGLLHLAAQYRDTARQQEAASLRILNELTYSLPDHLTNVPGAYGRIADIIQRNTEDLNAILLLSRNREAAEFEAAANYEKLAHARSVLGAYEEAIVSENAAIELFEGLSETDAEKAGAALASAYNNRGSIHKLAGNLAQSATDFSLAISLLEASGDADPLDLARVYYNAGASAVAAGSNDTAADSFENSLALLEDLEETEEVIEAKAQANYNYGILLYRRGEYDSAEGKLSAAFELYDRLTAITDSLLNRSSLVRASSAMAMCLTDLGRFSDADRYYEQAYHAAKDLAGDADNVDYQTLLAEICINRGLCFNIQGNYSRADEFYTMAADLYKTIVERTEAASDGAVYALALLNTGENAFKRGDFGRSRQLFEDGLAVYENACRSLGDYDVSQYYAWLSYYQVIHLRQFDEALSSALTAVELQPNNVLANLNLAYACLYAGYPEDADALLTQIAGLGDGQAATIRMDLEAQQRSGLTPPDIPFIQAMIA